MDYNLFVLFNPSQDPASLEAKLKKHAEKSGFAMQDITIIGKKNLTFPIKKQTAGFYATATIVMSDKKPGELLKSFKLDESILRSLVLKKEEVKGESSKLKDQSSK